MYWKIVPSCQVFSNLSRLLTKNFQWKLSWSESHIKVRSGANIIVHISDTNNSIYFGLSNSRSTGWKLQKIRIVIWRVLVDNKLKFRIKVYIKKLLRFAEYHRILVKKSFAKKNFQIIKIYSESKYQFLKKLLIFSPI